MIFKGRRGFLRVSERIPHRHVVVVPVTTLGQNRKKFGARARRTSFANYSTMASPQAVFLVSAHSSRPGECAEHQGVARKPLVREEYMY